MTDRLAIYLLLAGCLIFGGVIIVDLEAATDDEVAVSTSAAPAGAAVAVHRQPSTHVDELLAAVLSRPLFSSTRRPPQSAVNDGPSGADLGDTRLTGIVTEPGRHLAIFAVNGAKPLRLSEGEAVSGWRIESITPREVSLSGPGGTKTLEPKVDPSLPQGGPAPAPTPVNPAARPPVPFPAGAAALPRPGVPPTLPNPPLPRPARPGNRP
jgi:general secretion pathway protein N